MIKSVLQFAHKELNKISSSLLPNCFTLIPECESWEVLELFDHMFITLIVIVSVYDFSLTP